MSGKLASGHTYDAMEAKEREQYMKDFTGPMNDMIVLQPDGMVVPNIYPRFQEKVFNFKVLSLMKKYGLCSSVVCTYFIQL